MQRLKADGVDGSLISGTVKGFAGTYKIPSLLKPGGNKGGGGSAGGSSGGGKPWRLGAVSTHSSGAPAAPVAAGRGNSASSSSLGPQGFGGTAAMGFSSSAAATAAAAAGGGKGGGGAGSIGSRSTAAEGGVPHAAAAAVLGDLAQDDTSSSSGPDSPTTTALIGAAAAARRSAAEANSLAAWQAAALPAAEAAADTALALAAAGLPAPPVRAARAPEQRLAQDALLLLPSRSSLAYLDGSLPGDQGFDPLGLMEPAADGDGAALLDRRWLVTSEVIHSRVAMLAVLGCLLPEAVGGPVWFRTGWLPGAAAGTAAAGADDPAAAAWSSVDAAQLLPSALAAATALVVAAGEAARWADYRSPGSMAVPLQVLLPRGARRLSGGFAGSGVAAYPGGPLFNAAGLLQSGDALGAGKESELKHGRLAMLALAGFAAQALVTGQGPWANLLDHLHAPVQHNLLTNLGQVIGDEGGMAGGGAEAAEAAEAAGRPFPGGAAGLAPQVAALTWETVVPLSSLRAAQDAAAESHHMLH